ncbi:TauD/TfdA dioxygenase family protein [Sphingobium subterraneum]|uniref:Taurine dioxygenase n=1 Tax=Sphingobium subterraneum TaxID=627688 RepID=A0A841J6P0_9SPHN|nr:TauD/TfdA family dioxygenase [Sphingobium subterraneum]MBB6124218.1 taurine dioxygenase [Sphingobium subterraneum]
MRETSELTRFSCRNLHPAIGAEVLGLDLSVPLAPEVVADLIALWEDRSVLVFRDQKLSPQDQLRVTDYFGPPSQNEHKKDIGVDLPEQETPGIVLISNVQVDGKPIGSIGDGELWFHSDNCYLPKSAKASLLYAVEIPRAGGETRYASGYAAYQALSPETKAKLNGVMADYVFDYKINTQTRRFKPGPDAFHAVHPAVVLHPGTGRPALFVNRQTTERLIGMDPEESEALLQELFDFQERPEFVYDHQWRPGDLAIWDNRSCLHARKDFDPGERRTMRRTTAGEQKLEPALA